MTSQGNGPAADERLELALSGLVAAGRLDAGQADAVREAYGAEAGSVRGVESARPGSAAGRIPEVLGYLGGAFVVAAVLLVLGWSWEDFSYPTRLVIAGAAAVATFGAGLAIALGAAGGRRTLREPQQSTRRRLVGVLLVAGAAIAAGWAALVLDRADVEHVFPWAALVALALAAVAVRLAPGVIPALGLFGASLMAVLTMNDLPGQVPQLTWILVFLALGLLWAFVGPWFTGTKETALALGLGTLVVTAWVAAAYQVYEPGPYDLPHVADWGEEWVAPLGMTVLAVVAVVGVALYLRGGPWPWMAAGTAAAIGLVVELTGDAFGPAVAALVAGVVLLAASGLLVLRRGRVERSDSVSAPGP